MVIGDKGRNNVTGMVGLTRFSNTEENERAFNSGHTKVVVITEWSYGWVPLYLTKRKRSSAQYCERCKSSILQIYERKIVFLA